MSYGVWRKRGKGWSSIEIDSPWNHTFHDMADIDEEAANKLKRRLGCSYNDNPHFVQWEHTQTKKGWEFIDVETGGEHSLTVAYENQEGLTKARKRIDYKF